MTERSKASTRGNEPLFRPEAVRSAHYRWFGPVRLVTPPTWRIAIVAAVVSTGMLAVAAILAEVPDRVQATGMLLPRDGLLKIRAPRSGRIEALHIANGVKVDAGRPILRISGIQHAPGERPEIESRIDSLERELQAQDRAAEGEITATRASLQHSQDRERVIGRQIVAVTAELEVRGSQLAVYEAKAEKLADLARTGGIPQQLAEEAQLTALQAAATAQATRHRLLELEEKRLQVRLHLESDRLRIGTLRDQAQAAAQEILRQIEAGRLQSSTELVAAREGIISGLTVGRGQLVERGELLATLHDPRSPLEARIYLPSSSAARIDVGQRVELALDAFPRETYGTFAAVVDSVSPAAVPASEIVPGTAFSGPVFELRARLMDSELKTQDSIRMLPAGTSVSADIIRHRWPLYQWLWRAVTEGNVRS